MDASQQSRSVSHIFRNDRKKVSKGGNPIIRSEVSYISYYNSSQSMAVYDSLHSLLDHERLLLHCDEWRTANPCSHVELLLS
jgi:hypothetical protein